MPMLIFCMNSVSNMIKFTLFGQFGDAAIVLTSNDIILYAVSGVILFTIGIIFFGKFVNEVIFLTLNDIILYAVSGVTLFTIGMIFLVGFINKNKIYLRKSINKSIEIK